MGFLFQTNQLLKEKVSDHWKTLYTDWIFVILRDCCLIFLSEITFCNLKKFLENFDFSSKRI